MSEREKFYVKKLLLYTTARDNLVRAIHALVAVQKLEENAACPDMDEIVEAENFLVDLEQAREFVHDMVDAVEALI